MVQQDSGLARLLQTVVTARTARPMRLEARSTSPPKLGGGHPEISAGPSRGRAVLQRGPLIQNLATFLWVAWRHLATRRVIRDLTVLELEEACASYPEPRCFDPGRASALLAERSPAICAPSCPMTLFASTGASTRRIWERCSWARLFCVSGAPIRLTRTEFDLVQTLMEHPGRVFTKGDLYLAGCCPSGSQVDYALGVASVTPSDERAVTTHMGNVRAKLKPTGTAGYIQAVWGIGFKLDLP